MVVLGGGAVSYERGNPVHVSPCAEPDGPPYRACTRPLYWTHHCLGAFTRRIKVPTFTALVRLLDTSTLLDTFNEAAGCPWQCRERDLY